MPQQPQHAEVGKRGRQGGVFAAHLLGVAAVEVLGLVELGVAAARGVGADGAGLGVEARGRLLQRLTARQPPVGLDREGDRDRQPGGAGGARHPDRLLDVGERVGGDHRDPGRGQRRDLRRVVALGFLGAQLPRRPVGVALGTEGAADGDRRRRALPFLAQALAELGGFAVDLGQPPRRVAEPLPPVRAGAPGRRVEGEADLVLAGELEEALVVAAQRLAPARVLEQDEGRELRQLDPLLEDHRRLEAAVADERPLPVGNSHESIVGMTRSARPGWLLDEVGSAGRENLDAAHVDRYDEKEDAGAEAEVALLERHGLGAESTVVELGPGTGQFTVAVAPRCKQVVAVDVSEPMLGRLRSKLEQRGIENVEVVRAGFLREEHSTFSWLLEPMLERCGFELVAAERSEDGIFAKYLLRAD